MNEGLMDGLHPIATTNRNARVMNANDLCMVFVLLRVNNGSPIRILSSQSYCKLSVFTTLPDLLL